MDGSPRLTAAFISLSVLLLCGAACAASSGGSAGGSSGGGTGGGGTGGGGSGGGGTGGGGTGGSCTAGGACAPANPCHSGVVSCTTGTATCADTGTALSDGTACGSSSTCQAGSCVAATSGCGVSGAQTGDMVLSMQVAGTTRTYEVLVPSSYSASTPRALVFGFHGVTGTSFNGKAFGIQDAPGASDQAIFVFPQGIAFVEGGVNYGVGWNEHCGSYDMAFFQAMVEHLAATYCIDRTRILAAGYSWGADFAVNLGCCLGTQVRAVAPTSGADANYNPTCSAPLPALRLSYSVPDGYPQAAFDLVVSTYRAAHQCGTATTALASPCVSYQGCDAPVVECPYPGLGHVVPPTFGADVWAWFSSLP